jgi:hypothetical protein
MRCRECDYPLWNLKTRQCPECGSQFAPDQFDFRPNSVRFCCPHCEQAYYGTDVRGHLEPSAFACVTCGRSLTMNDMVLLPAEGLEETHTQVAVNRWLERHRTGRFKAWCSGIGQSLISPGQLMKGTPVESSMKQAWWFLTVTIAAVMVVSFIPALCFVVGLPYLMSASGSVPAGGPGPGMMAGMMGGMTVVMFVIVVPATLLYVLVWGLATHGILRVGGRGHETIRRTFQALCYSSGVYVTSVIPCLGSYVAPVWWVVSAVLMVRTGHKVSGARATFSVVTFPVVVVVLAVAAYVTMVGVIVYSSRATTTSTFTTPVQKTQVALDAVLDHAADDGSWPAHALALAETGLMTEWDYLGTSTPTDMNDVPVGGGLDLLQFVVLPEQDRAQIVEKAAEALPAGVVAHRVGDFVFTYHEIATQDAAGGLWLVVMTPDPDVSGGPSAGPVVVGMADGNTRAITRNRFRETFARQNQLRINEGLPPLPDPTTITHDAPATAKP